MTQRKSNPRPSAARNKSKTDAAETLAEKPRVRVAAVTRRSSFVETKASAPDPFAISGGATGQPDFAKETGRRGAEVQGLVTGPSTTSILNIYVARKRSRYAVLTNPYAKRSVDVLVSNVVGTGHKAFNQAPDKAFRKEVDKLWRKWCRECDTTGQLPFGGLEALAFRSMIEGGDSFTRFRNRRPEDNLSVPLQLQVIEAEQVPLHKNELVGPNGGQRVIGGVQFDAVGRPVFYHMYRDHPGDSITIWGTDAANTVSVPAIDVLQMHDLKRPQDARGMPYLAQMLIKLADLDRYMDAEMVRKKGAALIGGYIRRPADQYGGNPFATGPNANEDQEVIVEAIEPGAYPVLPYGYDVSFSNPVDVGANFEKFLRHQLLPIASSVNILYEQLTGDLSAVNDRTFRAAMLEFKRIVRALQSHIVTHQWCDPVYDRFFETAVLSGALVIPDGMDYDEAKNRRWVADPFEHMNPNQEIAAEADEIRAGLKSRSQALVERGEVPEEMDQQIAEDKERQRQQGLVFSTDADAVSRAGVQHVKPILAGETVPGAEGVETPPDTDDDAADDQPTTNNDTDPEET